MRFSPAILAMLVLSACGLRTSLEEHEHSFDGVKLLVRGEHTPYNKTHYLQESYDLAPGRRLLLRFESFAGHDVTLADDHRVMVQIGLANPRDSELATSSLRLCPLSSDWMMLATWEQAHPFSDAGAWGTQGGDFDPASCLTRSNATQNEAGEPAVEVLFDATRWYKDYPRGRNQNYGFVLIADRPITILGEKSGSLSPRILFNVAHTWIHWRAFEPN